MQAVRRSQLERAIGSYRRRSAPQPGRRRSGVRLAPDRCGVADVPVVSRPHSPTPSFADARDRECSCALARPTARTMLESLGGIAAILGAACGVLQHQEAEYGVASGPSRVLPAPWGFARQTQDLVSGPGFRVPGSGKTQENW